MYYITWRGGGREYWGRDAHEDLPRNEREHRVELLTCDLAVFVHVEVTEQALRTVFSEQYSI